MEKDFNIVIASDDVHENVFAEVYYLDKFCMLLYFDNMSNEFILEMPDSNLVENLIIRKIPLHIMEEAINKAKVLLLN